MTTDTFPTKETINVIDFFTVLCDAKLALRLSTVLPRFCTFAEAAQLPFKRQLIHRDHQRAFKLGQRPNGDQSRT